MEKFRHAPRVTRRVDDPPGVGAIIDLRRGMMDRGESSGLSWGQVAAGIMALLVVASCDSGTASTTSPGPTTTTATEPTTTAVTKSTTTTTTTTASPTTTTVEVTDEVSRAWDAFWEAWTTVRASEDLDPTPLEEVADPEVVEGALALFERQRESGSGPVDTDVSTHPSVTTAGSGEALVEDCVLLSPSFTEAVGVWYEADLRESDSGWVVSHLGIRSTTGCVPKEMATEAIAGYEAYYEAVGEFWDPPDPDHPLISEVLVEPRLGNVMALVESHRSQGVAFRTGPATHPEVIEIRSLTELVILDCYMPGPEDGLYDLQTGDRLPDPPPPADGQRNLRSAVMVFEDGKWKASDFQGQVDFACEFAPTERGLPSV